MAKDDDGIEGRGMKMTIKILKKVENDENELFNVDLEYFALAHKTLTGHFLEVIRDEYHSYSVSVRTATDFRF